MHKYPFKKHIYILRAMEGVFRFIFKEEKKNVSFTGMPIIHERRRKKIIYL